VRLLRVQGMSDENKKAFTVKDRRHFTSDGEARAEEQEATPEPEHPRAQAPPEPPSPSEESPLPEGFDFLSFVVSLASQAGELLSPTEGGPHLVEARQTIAILEILEEKTKSGFTKRETDAIGQILYELRMAYVAVSRKAGP
jgi:hypothetical protein